jgi:putative ABC transport system permease protein
MPIPWRYNLRSVFYRKAATILTIMAVALTVAILVVLLAITRGFISAVSGTGSSQNLICLRNSAQSEGESIVTREQLNTLSGMAGVARAKDGSPLIAGEMYAAVALERIGGGMTNVPIRGISEKSFELRGQVKLTAKDKFTPGRREVYVGDGIIGRIKGCEVGGTIQIGKDPWAVVGVISDDGKAFSSEIWGDVELLLQAFTLPAFNSAIFRIEDGFKPGTQPVYEGPITDRKLVTPGTGLIGAITDRVGELKVSTERDYFKSQSGFLGFTLVSVATFLTLLMSLGALAGCTNTLLAAVSSRTREIGGLLSIGFRPTDIFFGFLVESVSLCLIGGAIGVLATLPLQGMRTGTTNWQTFAEQTFDFQIDAVVIASALGLAILVGLIGGVFPAWRAARLKPVDALRRG